MKIAQYSEDLAALSDEELHALWLQKYEPELHGDICWEAYDRTAQELLVADVYDFPSRDPIIIESMCDGRKPYSHSGI